MSTSGKGHVLIQYISASTVHCCQKGRKWKSVLHTAEYGPRNAGYLYPPGPQAKKEGGYEGERRSQNNARKDTKWHTDSKWEKNDGETNDVEEEKEGEKMR